MARPRSKGALIIGILAKREAGITCVECGKWRVFPDTEQRASEARLEG